MSTPNGWSRPVFVAGFGLLAMLAAAPAHAATITLEVTIRDFCGIGYVNCGATSVHPDFERPDVIGVDDRGSVKTTLGADGTPQLLGLTSPTITSASSFAQWFHDTPGVNQTTTTTFTFDQIGAGVFQYNNQAYFPIDGQLINDRPGFSQCDYVNHFADCNHNFGFTTQIHSTFIYRQGQQTFDFIGDDDVWLFINHQLVIDLGGVHPAEHANVNLDSLGLVNGQVYDFDFFSAERHTVASTVQITTSNSFTPADSTVPEPATLTILGSGLAAALYRRRRKSQDR
jgi:fibro-slime domain-containing protein